MGIQRADKETREGWWLLALVQGNMLFACAGQSNARWLMVGEMRRITFFFSWMADRDALLMGEIAKACFSREGRMCKSPISLFRGWIGKKDLAGG
ncbi:MAG: hypothetical protein IJU76_08275 [Desulfovibrionaceae bacterium]|nr:hypothetical protein [Desulfovibrionaceae bacterium]